MTRWTLSQASPAPQERCQSLSFQRWNYDEGTCSAEFWRQGEGLFLLRFHGIADYAVDAQAGTVKCTPVEESDDAWRGTYDQQVQPLLLSLNGEQVFHGAAVAVGDTAIAFLGPSGRGKSTLTTAFARHGHAFLSDDCLHFDYSQPLIHVHPHAAHVRLWEDSASELGEGAASYVAGSPKPRLTAGARLPHCDHPLPLSRIYLLGEGEVDVPTITPLSPSQALIGLTTNAFVLDIKNPEVLKRNLRAGARLVGEVPMRRLDYPRRYDALSAVVEAVLADAAG